MSIIVEGDIMISKEELIKLYVDNKMSATEISKILKCDRKTVGNYLRRYDIPIRSAKETKVINEKQNGTYITIEDIIERIEKGYLIKDIVQEFGVSRSKISNICSKNGYNFRNHKNATKKQSDFMKENNPIPKGSNRRKEDVEKSSNTKRKKYLEYVNSLDLDKLSFKEYAKIARSLAYIHCYNKKVPSGYNIDHIFSVFDGYINKVPLDLISHKNNLRIIPSEENCSKGNNSLITLEEFYNKVGVQRLSEKE